MSLTLRTRRLAPSPHEQEIAHYALSCRYTQGDVVRKIDLALDDNAVLVLLGANDEAIVVNPADLREISVMEDSE